MAAKKKDVVEEVLGVTETQESEAPAKAKTPVFNPDKPYAENFGNPKDPCKYIQEQGGRVCHFKSDGELLGYAE